MAEALVQWPRTGLPRNPGAWLTAVAKRRIIDARRRAARLEDRYRVLAADRTAGSGAEWQPVPDDMLALIFTACHPVLSRQAQVTLTLKIVGGLTTEEIARLFVLPPAAVQQRIVRAKKALAAARVPFEVPEPQDWGPRLGGVLGVVYLMFTEGYAATAGNAWMRPELAAEALRIGRILAGLVPQEPEAHALVALMEFQTARFAARTGPDGAPVLLADQDRRLWNRAQIRRARTALARADARANARGRGSYALQAAIAQCHAEASDFSRTDWPRIVQLYEALARLAPSPVVELNRAVAVSMASGPAAGLELADTVAEQGKLRGSHLLPAVRAELLLRLGRADEARAAFGAAAALAKNDRERAFLERRRSGSDGWSCFTGGCRPPARTAGKARRREGVRRC